MINFDWTKEIAVRGTFESQKLSLLNKICIASVLSLAVVTSFFDDMGVMKHIWIALVASILVFELYRRIILPKISSEIVTDSNFKANGFVIVLTYILSSMSGAGLLTAFFNMIGISAAALLVLPLLPKYYFPSMAAIASIIFAVLAVTSSLHYLISVPVSIILAVLSGYLFKKAASKDVSVIEKDVESVSMLSGLPVHNSKSKYAALKTIFALFCTAVVGLIIVYWIMLSINPFWMRATRISKYETLHRLPHDNNLRVREVSSLADLEFYKKNIKPFPVVIKPSICTTNSRNVMKCDNYKCLEKYLKTRISDGPLGDGKNGDKGAWVIQEYSQNIEGVVFYYKFPYMSGGSIKNIGIRDSSVKGKSNNFGKSLTAQYWPDEFRTDFSPEYLKFFDDLASKIPGYNGGRFDIMLPSKDLKDPRGISVLELNVFFLGCIEEKTTRSVWDELKRLRTSLMQIYIGIVNIVAGYNFSSFFGIAWKVPTMISRAIICGNHEHIMAKP